MEKRISSTQNPLVKFVLQLDKPSARKESGLFIVEGEREIALAQNSNFEVETLFSHDDFLLGRFEVSNKVWVSEEVMNKIAVRGTLAGALALVKRRKFPPEQVDWGQNPLVLVLETVEKPGNLGAILRTADAAGVTAVWVCEPQTDIFNPNVVRSSLGCLFTVPVLVGSAQECLRFLLEKKISVYAAIVDANKNYTQCRFDLPTAVVLGSESRGLSEFWYRDEVQPISLPMRGKVDSMNVSVCAGILSYEALRQRKLE